jgi:ABC-type Zn uptake system ZnuABC Zn-binding protein ZnuA
MKKFALLMLAGIAGIQLSLMAQSASPNAKQNSLKVSANNSPNNQPVKKVTDKKHKVSKIAPAEKGSAKRQEKNPASK